MEHHIVRVTHPELTEQEREKRMEEIRRAAAKLARGMIEGGLLE